MKNNKKNKNDIALGLLIGLFIGLIISVFLVYALT